MLNLNPESIAVLTAQGQTYRARLTGPGSAHRSMAGWWRRSAHERWRSFMERAVKRSGLASIDDPGRERPIPSLFVLVNN
jgi:hypothetical protein